MVRVAVRQMSMQDKALYVGTQDDHPGAVASLAQLGRHVQARRRASVPDQLHDGLERPQGAPQMSLTATGKRTVQRDRRARAYAQHRHSSQQPVADAKSRYAAQSADCGNVKRRRSPRQRGDLRTG